MKSVPAVPASPTLRAVLDIAVRDRCLYAILAVFVFLATAWNFATPIFEAPDEPDHLQYILFVAEEGHRPDLKTEVQRAGIESPQPPLYYFIMGAVLRISQIPHPFEHPRINPEFDFLQMNSAPNYFAPASGRYDYVRFLRGFSMLFGLVTVVSTYLSATLLGANRALRLVAAAMTACLPQFTFVSGAISNDPLTTAVASIALVWLMYVARLETRHGWHAFIYGTLSALAFLSKAHAVFLLPFGAAVLFLIGESKLRERLEDWGWIVFGFLLIAGPYLVYNQWRYGDFTAVNMQVLIVPELVDRKSLLDPSNTGFFMALLPRLLFQSFLGVFGWMRIYLPGAFYSTFGILWLASLTGYGIALLNKRWDLLRETLVLAPALAFLVIVYVNTTFTAPQGRYLFPALGVISPLFVMGLAELPAAWNRLLMVAAPLFLLLTNLFSLWLVRSTFLSWHIGYG